MCIDKSTIADEDEIKAVCTAIMRSDNKPSERLKAAEILCKVNGLFRASPPAPSADTLPRVVLIDDVLL